MHIDYDYYDMISEQDDKEHKRKVMKESKLIFPRVIACILIGLFIVFGIAGLLCL